MKLWRWDGGLGLATRLLFSCSVFFGPVLVLVICLEEDDADEISVRVRLSITTAV